MNPAASKLRLNPKKNAVWVCLIILFGVLAFSAYYQFLGVQLKGDSSRYLEAAEKISQGDALNHKQKRYLGYCYFVYGVFQIGGSTTTLVIIQCLLSLAGALALFLAGRQAFSLPVGLLAAIWFLASPDIQHWNYYVLTDGPATSMLLVVFSLAVLCIKQPKWWLLLAPSASWVYSAPA
jgi:hypothetical protein